MSRWFLRLRKLIPLITFLLFSSISLHLWFEQIRHDQEFLSRHLETFAEQMKIRVEGFMRSRIASLELVADRWVERQPRDFSKERFVSFAAMLYRHYPGFLGIMYVDSKGVMQWVFPENADNAAKGKRISDYPDPQYRAFFETPDLGMTSVALPSVDLYRGGIGFHVLKSLVCDEKVQGYMDGVFAVDEIVNTGLGPYTLKDFDIELYEGRRLIYRTGQHLDESERKRNLHVSREIYFSGKKWWLELDPSPSLRAAQASGHIVFIIFGIGLSSALSLLIHSLFKRMAMYMESRDQALREVDEKERAQEALRKNEKKLEGLLAELSEKNQELESFVYTVSHDLKTPIVTIEGFIGALREDFGSLITETSDNYLKYMSDAAKKMERLINDLLNLSRIGRLMEDKTGFSLKEPLCEALETLKPLMEAKGIVVGVQENLPVVYAEKKRIVQLIENLLANAMKYIGKENAVPRIDVGCEDQNGKRVFFVRDNGIGIEERYFDKIFQIFERLPGAKQLGDGTGIGLTIVKRIVETHGGKIWLTSEPGRGTTFYFTLKDKDDQNGV